MKISKLENMQQLDNLKIGDIIPMTNQGSYLENYYEGMLEEKDGMSMIFFIREKNIGQFNRILIQNFRKASIHQGIYLFNCDGIDTNVILDNVDKNDPSINKYLEAIK